MPWYDTLVLEPLDLEHGKVLWSCADSSSSSLGASGLGHLLVKGGDVDHPSRRYPYGTVVTSNYSGCVEMEKPTLLQKLRMSVESTILALHLLFVLALTGFRLKWTSINLISSSTCMPSVPQFLSFDLELSVRLILDQRVLLVFYNLQRVSSLPSLALLNARRPRLPPCQCV